jgi:hypothetical protein
MNCFFEDKGVQHPHPVRQSNGSEKLVILHDTQGDAFGIVVQSAKKAILSVDKLEAAGVNMLALDDHPVQLITRDQILKKWGISQ